TLLWIRVLDGNRNPLALLINPQDDELPRLPLARNAGRFDDEAFDPRRKKLCMDDFEHCPSATRKLIDCGQRPATAAVITITRRCAGKSDFSYLRNIRWIAT